MRGRVVTTSPTPRPLIGTTREDLGAVSHQTIYDVLRLTNARPSAASSRPGRWPRYEARVADHHHHVIYRPCGSIAGTGEIIAELEEMPSSFGKPISLAQVRARRLCHGQPLTADLRTWKNRQSPAR